MKGRIEQLENKVNSLALEAAKHEIIVASLDTSMKTIASSMSEISNWMAAGDVREEGAKEFKLEVIHKLDKARTQRDLDRSASKKHNSTLDKKISLMEQSNEALAEKVDDNSKDIADIKLDKNKGLISWKSTTISVAISFTLLFIAAYLRGIM